MSKRRWMATAAISVLAAAAMPWASAAAAGGPGLPTVRENLPGSGAHGHPWLSVPTIAPEPIYPVINLAARGYVEREFVLSGHANEYQQAGSWGSDGRWGVSLAQSAVPYTTRIIVRYPTNARFNGTVVFEWLNESNNFEADPVWAESYRQLLAKGYAYVGVDAQTAGQTSGAAFLRTWDPVRYGSLSEPSDAQSYDIFTQAAKTVVADATTILGGLTPKHLIAAGDSQSAFRLVTYVNAFQPITRQFGGFLLVGRAVDAAPIGDGVLGFPLVAYIRSDNTTPVLQFNAESDVFELQTAWVRQPDTTSLRTWEIAGASHIDLHEGLYEYELLLRDGPNLAPPAPCEFGVTLYGRKLPNNLPLYWAEDAAMAALEAWVTHGTPPAHGSLISTVPVINLILRDQYNNALGGVRMPDISVPTESYAAANLAPPGSSVLANGLCLFSGFFVPFPAGTLHSLYRTHASYVAAYTTAAQEDEAAGFLTPGDYAAAVAAAQAAPIP